MSTCHGYSFSCALLPPIIGNTSGRVSPPISMNCAKGCVLRTLAIDTNTLDVGLQLITVTAEIKECILRSYWCLFCLNGALRRGQHFFSHFGTASLF